MGLMNRDSQPSDLEVRFIKSMTTIKIMAAHASVASNKPKAESDSHADTCVVGDNY